MGTFGLAKKDVSRENKKEKLNEKERGTCWQGRGGGEEEEGKAYGGHHPGKGVRHTTSH